MIDPFDEQAEQILYPEIIEDENFEDDGQPTELQENEDFAQDDDWHNMSASDMY